MVDLSERVRTAVIQGLGPIESRLSHLKDQGAVREWTSFTQGPTKGLLRGDLTVDQWKASLSGFCQRLTQTKLPPQELQAIVVDANGAAILVEEAFDPPSPMRWVLWGGVAATAFAWWWLRREEREKQKLVAATPTSIAGSPRAKRPTIEVEQIEEAEFEEI